MGAGAVAVSDRGFCIFTKFLELLDSDEAGEAGEIAEDGRSSAFPPSVCTAEEASGRDGSDIPVGNTDSMETGAATCIGGDGDGGGGAGFEAIPNAL